MPDPISKFVKRILSIESHALRWVSHQFHLFYGRLHLLMGLLDIEVVDLLLHELRLGAPPFLRICQMIEGHRSL